METDGSTKIDYRIPLIDEVSKAGMRTHGIDQVGYLATDGFTSGGGNGGDTTGLQEQIDANAAAITQNSTDISTNSDTITINTNSLTNLLDEVYGGESENLPWDLDLYSQSSGAWAFSGTVPGPLSSPNDYSAKFYLVGNVLYGYSHSSNADDGLNIFNEYVRIEGVDTSWLNIRLNDRGLTLTSQDTKTLSSGTYTVRWNGSGSDWEFEFSVTVP